MHQFKPYNISHSYKPFICVMLHIITRDVSCYQSYNMHITWHDSFICAMIQRDATARDPSSCQSCNIHNTWYVWHDSFICVIIFTLLDRCDMTHSCVWWNNVMQHHAIRRVISPTTRSYNLRVVVHDPFIRVCVCVCVHTCVCVCVRSYVCVCVCAFIRVMLQDDALIGVMLQRVMRGVMIATIHAMC